MCVCTSLRPPHRFRVDLSLSLSGVLKLSALSSPTRVYRGVKETSMQLPDAFLYPAAGTFAGGASRAAFNPLQPTRVVSATSTPPPFVLLGRQCRPHSNPLVWSPPHTSLRRAQKKMPSAALMAETYAGLL